MDPERIKLQLEDVAAGLIRVLPMDRADAVRRVTLTRGERSTP